ncbi:MAG: glycoside hydrolase family 31 protein [Eubacteriales bacterium]
MQQLKRGESTYNKQLGYLKVLFGDNHHFLIAVTSYSFLNNQLVLRAITNHKKEVNVVVSFVSSNGYRVQMFVDDQEIVNVNAVQEFETYPSILKEEDGAISLVAEELTVKVEMQPFRISSYYGGQPLVKQHITDTNVDNMCKVLPMGFIVDDNQRICSVHETMYLYADESFYGFGERFTGFDKRNQKFSCWQDDALCTNSQKSYKNHPFFISSHKYGMLINSFAKIDFDMGHTSGVSYSAQVYDTVLDYVVFAEDSYKKILKEYLKQLGAIPTIPKWAFGLWMSRCTYQTRAEIEEVVTIAEERGHKIDVIHIDGWQFRECDGFWEWDTERFPNHEEMIRNLHEKGIKISIWNWPYVKEDTPSYDYAKEKGYLVKDQAGGPALFSPMATVDFHVGCFDFTNPEMCQWYASRIRSACNSLIDVIKTDFSEALPETAVFYDGSTGLTGHNKLTYLYAKTVYHTLEAIKKEGNGEQAMLWGRSGYAGSHRIPAAWAGDSSTALNDHACILRGGLSAAMSGIPFWGFDMGGFYNTDTEGYECFPSDMEYIRSFQFGLFAPLARCHGKTKREPWVFEESTEKIFIKFNDFRHRMMPYLYMQSLICAETYVPLMRPMILEFEEDLVTRMLDRQYMLGESLLVAPTFDEDTISVYLPKGKWYDLVSGEVLSGGKFLERTPKIDEITVFMRENTVLPLATEKLDSIDLVVFIQDEITTSLFIDEVSYDFHAIYEDGTIHIDCGGSIGGMKFVATHEVKRIFWNQQELNVQQNQQLYHYNFKESGGLL